MRKRILQLAAILPATILLCACLETKDKDAIETARAEIPYGIRPANPAKNWWKPTPGLSWQWQLTGRLDFSIKTDVVDVDWDVHDSVVDAYHAQETKVICYVNVGAWEDWRADAPSFPEGILGNDYEGWAGERWLDIRQITALAPIMRARLDACAQKGFDAIEPDNIEVYTNNSGFPITYADQLRYAVWLADEAHARGLAIGLKNAPDQVGDLVGLFDFAIVEDCFYFGWCRQMLPFINEKKAVFAAEYTDLTTDFSEICQQSQTLGFSTILKRRNLDRWIEFCP